MQSSRAALARTGRAAQNRAGQGVLGVSCCRAAALGSDVGAGGAGGGGASHATSGGACAGGACASGAVGGLVLCGAGCRLLDALPGLQGSSGSRRTCGAGEKVATRLLYAVREAGRVSALRLLPLTSPALRATFWPMPSPVPVVPMVVGPVVPVPVMPVMPVPMPPAAGRRAGGSSGHSAALSGGRWCCGSPAGLGRPPSTPTDTSAPPSCRLLLTSHPGGAGALLGVLLLATVAAFLLALHGAQAFCCGERVVAKGSAGTLHNSIC